MDSALMLPTEPRRISLIPMRKSMTRCHITNGVGSVIAASFQPGTPQAPQALRLAITLNGESLDFSWPSRDGKVYDLVSSTDLSVAPETCRFGRARENCLRPVQST